MKTYKLADFQPSRDQAFRLTTRLLKLRTAIQERMHVIDNLGAGSREQYGDAALAEAEAVEGFRADHDSWAAAWNDSNNLGRLSAEDQYLLRLLKDPGGGGNPYGGSWVTGNVSGLRE